jgi:uncharacterized membrane protein
VTNVILSIVNRPDFALTVPASATTTSSAIAYVTIGYRALTPTAPTVTLEIAGLPGGMAANFTPNPTFGQTTMTVATDATVVAGTYPLVITATAGSVVHQYTLSMVVTGPPDFALSVPASANVVSGTTSYVVIPFQALGSAIPTVTLSITGLPTGMTGTFTPNPTNGQTTLAVTTDAKTPVGTYPVVITGTAGTIVHQYGLNLVATATTSGQSSITLVPATTTAGGTLGYGLGAAPSALTIPTGGAGSISVTAAPTGGFADPIQLAMSGLPAGATVTSTGAGNIATFNVTVPAGTAAGTYAVTITGTSGSFSASVVVTLTVT